MKIFVLTSETAYESGKPIMAISAESRESALRKINATDDPKRRKGFWGEITTDIPNENLKKLGLPLIIDEDHGYVLREVPFLD